MFDFANPHLLYLLLTCVAAVVLYVLARAARRRKLRRFGRPEVVETLMPEASRYKPTIKIVLLSSCSHVPAQARRKKRPASTASR